MAGASCSLGGVPFAALNGAVAGRYCLECFAENFEYSIRRFHAPGVAGNFIIRGNRMGGQIIARMRYVGTYPNVRSLYNADKNAWNNTAVTVVDEAGASYLNCNLAHMRAITRPHNMGRGGGLTTFDAEAVFHYDG